MSAESPTPPAAPPIGPQAPLERCPTCKCPDLFIRKDFPQKLGLSIVVLAGIAFLALAANPRTFYLGVFILIAATLVDAIVFFFVKKITVCYRCRSEFRNVPPNRGHGAFELSVAEKYRTP